MKKLKTNAATDIFYGRIKLDEKTANRHKAALKKIGKNTYEVLGKVQLKAGIEFAYDGETNRAFFETLTVLGDEKPDAAQ